MTLFLSTYINKIDRKGRVSVPAPFRTALAKQEFQGIVVFKSPNFEALEGFGMDFMEEIASRLDHFDLFSDEQDDMASMIFGQSRQLPLDGDGRIVFPKDLAEDCGITDQIAFVGMGKKFQIWAPEKWEDRQNTARDKVTKGKMTIPKPNKE